MALCPYWCQSRILHYYANVTGLDAYALPWPRSDRRHRGYNDTASAPSKLFFSSHHSAAMPSIDIIPDEDDENLQPLPHDTQGDTGTSDNPAGASQPEAQQPARTAPSQRKSTRHFFGIPQRGPQVRGNDPFDYEQRFPEDKRYEELGPLARVWRTYLEECGAFDIELLEGWRDGLDVLLVFAGLFSAVVTTFVVQTSQNLQVNYSQVTATLLFELIDVQRAAANGTLVNDVPRSDLTPFSDFRPTISDSLVNGLWFTSLSFSLATALFAVLTKQWIHQYIAMPSGTPQDRCRVRQFRYMGLEQWGVGFIIGLLPLLLSMSLGIFLIGLVLFLVPLQAAIASIVGTTTFVTFAIYIITNLLPVWYPSCPYKTPLSQYIFLSYAYTIRLITLVSSASTPTKPPPRKFRDVERAAVELRADDLDVYTLGWLSNMSSNPSVQNIVIQSTSALPLRSVEPLKQYAERFSEMYKHGDFNRMAMTGQESTIDRLLRVSLRFGNWSPYLMEIDWPSAEIYAEVLCIDYFNSSRTNEIANLVKAQFTESPDKRLCLQPIVWAHLLQTLLPFTLESGLIPLFLMIPEDYWRATYKPPPLFPKNNMKIRSISGEDHHAVSLQSAVSTHLYPDIADALLKGFTHVKDSIFHPDPATDEFPAPQDAHLLFLLTLAGSPSIRKTVINPSMEALFVQVLRNIGIYMGVDDSFLSTDEPPSFELDSNRYAVLKLLYMLVSSDDFGTTMMADNQRSTLMLFLQVLNSTTPRPRFLASDWCTLTMTSNFTQLAFKDQAWTLYPSSVMALEFVYEFLQLGEPLANQILSRFVSGRLLDYVVKLRGDHEILLSRINLHRVLGAFVSGVKRSDAAVAYLFELDNIFAVCAMYIIWQDIPGLRLLAQCCPDHPVWTECLQKLDTILEHFELLSQYREQILCTVSDFRVLLEGGESKIFNSQPTVSSLWRRLWQRHRNIGKELTGASKV
ncbi:hypothetical protein EV421DRAFT_1743257 [Armillaria borealis]|uniref:DUF6535 domain-containing protein n=1 Tax=Armillaria borealis TaxID=47425 RepID=A0AA39MF71_9AGAR|nr:hypothetical protein EV421DRAFT_1743257 [Armillaria borealis]